MEYKTFQDYWDNQIQRLEKYKTPLQMNEMFDECEKTFNASRKTCDCQPFNSCEKCATKWKDIPQGMKIDTEYWLLDASNKIGRGMKRQHTITLYFSQCDEDFGIPVMFAEIKPPESPK